MMERIKLRYVVALVMFWLVVGILVMGYCKGREQEIRQNHAVSHSIHERPVYYTGGGR